MAKTINAKQKEILARKLGYDGPMNSFESFIESDLGLKRKYNAVVERYMARGGMVKGYAVGGAVTGKIDFANLDITQYPLDSKEQRSLNTALQNLVKEQEKYNKLSSSAKQRGSGKASASAIERYKQDITNTINGASNDLNEAMANYILNAGERQSGAGFNIAQKKLNDAFTSRNLPIPEKLQDINYVKEAYENITTAANRQATRPADANIFQREFANAFVAKSDFVFTGTRPKEQVLQDVLSNVTGSGNTPDRLRNALVIEKVAEPVKYAASYVEQPAPAPAVTAPTTTAPAAGTAPSTTTTTAPAGTAPTTTVPTQPAEQAPEMDETARMIMEMAVKKREPDLQYDFTGDGRITSADALAYTRGARPTAPVQQPVAQQPVAQQPVAQQPVQPVQPAPVQPTQPVTQQPVQQPVSQQPTVTPTVPTEFPPVTTRPPTSRALPDWVVPPPPGSINTMAFMELTNPATGEKFMAPTGGYSVRPDLVAQQPAPVQQPVAPTVPSAPVTGGAPSVSQPTPVGTPVTPITEASPVTGTVTTPTAPGVGSVTSPITTPVSPAPPPPTAPTTKPVESVTAPTTQFPLQTSPSAPEAAPDVAKVPQIPVATIQPTLEQTVSTPAAPGTAVTAIPQMATGTAQVADVVPATAATVSTTFGTPMVGAALTGLQPAMGTVSQQAQVQAATMEPTSTAVGQLQAAQGVAGTVQGAPTRTLQEGELVAGPTVDQAKIEATLQANEAAQGVVTEDMTVQGQLSKLTANFEAGNPPAWAAASLRNANAILAQRGLGASSLAGQAIVQAALEAALPIAAADAQTYREMGIQNLSNKQQMAVLTAQQRAAFLGQEFDQAFQTRTINAATISQIANVNFSAQQQIALENARLAETVNLANLSNRQALVMAEAAQIANLETANLNNRQQANVLNAQAFLQMDMANLSNRQQTAIFKAQSMVQSILTDAAADNASKQFNASSVNQVNQFYDGLSTQIKQFNATQTNAMNQFNVSQLNSIAQFNAGMQNQRDQFNAEFRKVIDQSNAEWRRNIALQNTAAINRANEFNATAALGITTIEYNNLWQDYRDKLEYAWKTTENALDRENELARQVLAKQAQIEAAKMAVEAEKMKALGNLGATVLDKTGALNALGTFLFGSGAAAAGAGGAAGGAAAGATKGIITGGLEALREKVFGSNTGYTAVTKKDDPSQYWTDGKTTLTLKPNGDFFVGNSLMGNYSGVTGTSEFDYSYAGAPAGYANYPSLDDFLNSGSSTTLDWSNYNYSGVSE